MPNIIEIHSDYVLVERITRGVIFSNSGAASAIVGYNLFWYE